MKTKVLILVAMFALGTFAVFAGEKTGNQKPGSNLRR